MLSRTLSLFSMSLFAFSTLAAHAQFYKVHNGDLGVNAEGVLGSEVLTSDTANTLRTTDTTGFLFSFKEHPVSWAGIEFNYGYSKYSNRFSDGFGNPSANINATRHEATAAYLFHPHVKHLQPFVGVGGGYLGFVPMSGASQWRGTGLLEAGLDIPTQNPHFGFRVQGRALLYREPNFYNSAISTETWVARPEPTAGVYYRF